MPKTQSNTPKTSTDTAASPADPRRYFPGVALWERGLRHLVPLKPGTKKPFLKGWNGRGPATREEVELWDHRCYGLGLLCKDFFGVDIDTMDPVLSQKLLDTVLNILGPTPTRTGQAPKTLAIYWAGSDVSSSALVFRHPNGAVERVEILGRNRDNPETARQFVVLGTHEKTQQPYVWHGDITDPNVHIPSVHELDVLLTMDRLKDILVKYGCEILSEGPTAADGTPSADSSVLGADARDEQVVLDAIDHIPNAGDEVHYDEWVRVGHAIKSALGDTVEAFEAFDAWSSKSDKYDEAQTRRAWDSFTPSGKVGAGTLIWKAGQEGGWEAPDDYKAKVNAEKAKSDFDDGYAPGDTSVADPVSISPDEFDVSDAVSGFLDGSNVIPPRPYLLGTSYMRGEVMLTGGPGGVAKTQLAITEAISMICEEDVTAGGDKQLAKEVWESGINVLHINLDDPQVEMVRRITGVCRHYGIDPGRLKGRYHVIGSDSPWADKLRMVQEDRKSHTGYKVRQQAFDALRELCQQLGVSVLVIDPLANFTGAVETGDVFLKIADRLVHDVAQPTQCAVHVIHHSRKQSPGQGDRTIDDFRGGSTLVNRVRSARMLEKMTKVQARECGIPEDRRGFYFRETSGLKPNYSPTMDEDWYELVSVGLGNAQGRRPEDKVGVPRRWQPPVVAASTNGAVLQTVLTAVAQGAPNGYPWRAKQSNGAEAQENNPDALAEHLGLPRNGLSGALKTLEERGYIKQADRQASSSRRHPVKVWEALRTTFDDPELNPFEEPRGYPSAEESGLFD